MENLKNGDNIETTTLKKQFLNELIAEDTTKIEVKSTSDNLLISNPTSEEIVQESTTTKGIYKYIRFDLFFNSNIQNHFGAHCFFYLRKPSFFLIGEKGYVK